MNLPADSAAVARPAPGVVTWFKIYCAAMAVLYLACAVAGVLLLIGADWLAEQDPEFTRLEGLIGGVLFLVGGAALLALFAVAPFLPPRPWVWIAHLVLICFGLTSACCMPASIPLLIFWIKPETRHFYGRWDESAAAISGSGQRQ